VCAGQWRYASSKLKAICCKQHAGSLRAIASAAEQQPQAAQQEKAQGHVGPAADAADQPPVDASGKHVLLRSVDEMADAFWKESKMGTALLQEVREGCAQVAGLQLCPRLLSQHKASASAVLI
jgi:hypothetical protein